MKKFIFLIALCSSFYVFSQQTFLRNSQLDNLNRLTQYRFNANTVVDYCYDELGNRTCRNVQALVVQQPDVTFINIPTATPGSVSAGGQLCINGAENNTGQGAAGAHNIKYYLSSNTTLDGNDVLLGSTSVNSIAAGGSFAINNVCFNIPAGTASGTWYILVVADADGSIIETNENNNTAVIQITVVNCSSLQVSTTATNTSCGLNNGSVSYIASGGQSPFTRLWSNGSTAVSISNLAAGTYFLTLTDGQGCSVVSSATVNGSTGVSIAISSTNTSCQSNTGSATVSVSSGTPNYSYTWSNNATTATINNLAAGNYAVTVRDANNCSATGSVAINVNAPSSTPVFSAILITQAGTLSVCEGQSLTLNMANGYSNYYWSNGVSAQQQIITFNSPGSQIITGSASNCAGNYYDTVFVTVNALPSAAITPVTASICSGQSITLTATGGTAYAWSNGATTAAINVSPSVTTGYTVTVTGAGGCTATETRTVTVNGAPMVAISPATAAITVGQSITLTASGSSTYSWSNGGNTAAVTVSPAITTNYTVTATNAAGCTAVSSRIVTVNPVNSIFIKPDNVQVSGNSVSFTYPSNLGTVANLNPSFISIIGEATGYKTGSLTQQGNVLTFNCSSPINPGELLHIIIKKGMRNTVGDSLTPFNKIIYAPAATTSCGLFDTLTTGIKFPNTVYSYSINTADFDKNGTQDIVCHYFTSYGAATNLVVYLRNANGTFQAPVSYSNAQSHSGILGTPDLNNDGYPDIVVNHNVPSAIAVWLNNGNGTFTSSPSLYNVSNYSNGARFLDIDNDGFLDIVSFSGVSSLSLNRVSVLRNNGNGTFAAQVVYSTNSAFGSQLQPIDLNNDGWIDLAYTSNSSYSSQPTFQLFQNNQSGQVSNILNQPNAAEWYVTGVADFNSDGNEDLLVGKNNAAAIWWGDGNAGFNANTNLNSLSEQFTSIGDIDGDGKLDLIVKHQWTNPTGQNPYTIHRNLGNGNFSTTTGNRCFAKFGAPKTQDLNGDGALDYFYVGNNDTIYFALNRAKPVVSTTANPNPVCAGQTATVAATAGFTGYVWSNGSSNNSFQTSVNGLYNVTVTDAVGCTNTASVTLNSISAPTVNISPANASVCSGQNITLIASGGGTYSWSHGLGTGATKQVSPSANTTYTVTVTDANGCTATASRLVTVNANPTAAITPSTVAICNGQSATLTASGGGTYAWSNSGGSNAQATFSPTVNTTYTVTVTAANGCTATASRLVTVNANPTAAITPSTVAICNGQSATLTASGVGTYVWSNSGGSNAQAIFSPTTNTTYTVTVTNTNNCTATASRLVTVNANPTAAITPSTVAICNGQSATLTASGGGTYVWSNSGGGNAQAIFSPTTNTTYTVTVTNTNNCTATASRLVTVNANPMAAITPSTVAICNGQSATLTASGGGTYAWSNSGGSNAQAIFSPTTNTTYTVTVTNTNNCTATASRLVTVNANPTAAITPSTVAICNGQSATLTASGGGTYAWSNSGGGNAQATFLPTTNTTYTVTVTNANNCTATASRLITVKQSSTFALNQSICSGQSYSFNGQALTQSGIYYDTLVNAKGCDSLITLNLSVGGFVSTNLNKSICQGNSYLFNNVSLTQSGVYRDTLTASNGCDSIITLNLAVNNHSASTINQSICTGQSYSFNGQTLTQPGIYFDTLTNANGCDSLITLNLSVGSFASTTLNESICQGSSYFFKGTNLTQGGVYKDTLTAASGCDSIVTLNLAVNNHSASTINQSICSGQSYSFNGQALTQSGIYYDTLVNAKGCDSLITLNLSVGGFVSTNLNKSICQGNSYLFNNVSLTQSGVYKDTLTSSSGCDSIITLNLSVNPITTTSISDVICIGNIYNFNGRILTSPGVYSDTLPSVIGCDSIIVLTLNNSATTPPTVALSTQTTSICTNQLVTVTAMVQNNSGSISYQWYLNGSLIFNPGATFSTTSFNSNDSIRVVVLTSDGCGNSKAIISNTIVFTVQTILAKPIISVSDSIICAGDSVLLSTVQSYSAYLWSNGDTTSSTTVKAAGPHSVQVFSACASATSDPVILKMSSLQQPSVLQASNDSLYSSIAGVSYQWYFNNTFVLGATQSSVIASQNGDYAVEVRDNLGCSSRSANYNFVRTGINKVMDFKLNVYPNPTSSLLSVETNVKVDIIVVYDVIGSVVARIQNPMLKQDIDFSLFASGMYNIVVHRDGIMQNVKVLKE